MKDGMVLYASYAEKFKKLSDAQFGKLIRYVMRYQLDGVVPDIDDIAVSLSFDVIKFNLDNDNEKYEKVVERNRENGKKGGRPKKEDSENPTEPKKPNGFSENPPEPKKADKDKDKEKDMDKDKEKKESMRRFAPPSLSEVEEYCRERNNGIDAQAFVDFYTSKGWKIGSAPMKDWKAAVRTWERRQKKDTPPIDENTRKRREKYSELEMFYLGEER